VLGHPTAGIFLSRSNNHGDQLRPHLHRAAQKINLGNVFAGQRVGIKEVSEKIWLVTFINYDLGFFDDETGRVECAERRWPISSFLGHRGPE
jgi:hypothetical protein